MNISPDTRLTRIEAAAALTAAGFKTAPSTLASYEAHRKGPAFTKISNRAIYEWGLLIEWARGRVVQSKSHA
jgi:hypothetical protein